VAAASRGTITFDRCTADTLNTTGTSFPFIGLAATTPGTVNVGACGGSPTIGVDLPPCACVSIGADACIAVTKFCTDATALGQPINFNGTVRNCGTDALNAVTVVDDRGTPGNALDDVTVVGPIPLSVGESQPYSGSYTPGVSGPSTDTVTARGTGAISGLLVTAQASATCMVPPPGGEGCTPGYWKQSQHFDSWLATGFLTNQSAGTVFSGLAAACPALATKTLLASLQGGGGSTFCEKVQILIRAGVAAVLNAAHPGIAYPLTVAEIQTAVNAAIASGDATTVTNLGKDLDNNNNLFCPLN
jgi:hypothetical protein